MGRESKQSFSRVVTSLFLTVAVNICPRLRLLKAKAIHLREMSDIMVRSLALGLPQPDLQRNKCSHSHMEEKLPEVAQFVEIHVAQTD